MVALEENLMGITVFVWEKTGNNNSNTRISNFRPFRMIDLFKIPPLTLKYLPIFLLKTVSSLFYATINNILAFKIKFVNGLPAIKILNKSTSGCT